MTKEQTMTFTVQRPITALTDDELLTEYEKAVARQTADSGPQNLRAEVVKRMRLNQTRHPWDGVQGR
jgi:hypothetical protein